MQLTWASCSLAVIIVASGIIPLKQLDGSQKTLSIRHGKISIHKVNKARMSGALMAASPNRILYRIGGSVLTGVTKVYIVTVPDHYSLGKILSGPNISDLIYRRILSGQLPSDPNGIYLMLSSADVKESFSSSLSFCKEYCGYHNKFSAGTKTYIYGFIGHPKQCPNLCLPRNRNVSPNGDPGVDAMLNAAVHEIMEAMSNPLMNSWYDATTERCENADLW
ncbi:unnamed protein product [Rotaria sp. Silwood1]|nr:unnamed protein product [Rotaria sp. Silwood1]